MTEQLKRSQRTWARETPRLSSEWLWAAAAAVGLFLSTSSSAAASHYALELPQEGLNEEATKRRMALELRELDVPGDPRRPGESAEDVSLFIRVRWVGEAAHDQPGEALEVELWDRGESAGIRRVSPEGQATTVARRLALAVVELTRGLKTSRAREKKAIEREERARVRRQEDNTERARRAAPQVLAVLEGTLLGGEAWSWGPNLGFEWNRAWPLRLRADVGFRAGELREFVSASELDHRPHFSSYELRLTAARGWELSRAIELETGGFLAASSLHLSGAGEVDGLMNQKNTWSSRGGAELALRARLGEELSLRVGVQAGVLLRPVSIRYEAEETKLQGGFIGLGVGIVVSP